MTAILIDLDAERVRRRPYAAVAALYFGRDAQWWWGEMIRLAFSVAF